MEKDSLDAALDFLERRLRMPSGHLVYPYATMYAASAY